MFSLRRIKSGPFFGGFYALEKLEELKDQNNLASAITEIDKVLLHFPEINLTVSDAMKLKMAWYCRVRAYSRVYKSLLREYFSGSRKGFEKEDKRF